MSKYWLIVASRDHIKVGEKAGFVQAGHGKRAPLKRMSSGDGIVCYATKAIYGEKEPCQKFVATGFVTDDVPYQVEVSDEFSPFRRAVEYAACDEVEIRPMLEPLEFIENPQNWGLSVRSSLREISEQDFNLIRSAMGIGA